MISRISRLFPDSPPLYFLSWTLWFAVLWILSSSNPSIDNAPKIPHFDKVAHFGYFFGGGGLLTALLITLQTKLSIPKVLIPIAVFYIGATVGAIDEIHQSFTPGRNGNDPFDWFADCLGTITGSLIMLWLWTKRD